MCYITELVFMDISLYPKPSYFTPVTRRILTGVGKDGIYRKWEKIH